VWLVPALSPARLPEIRKVFALVLSLNQIAFRVLLRIFQRQHYSRLTCINIEIDYVSAD
jgi:hypothetical protein